MMVDKNQHNLDAARREGRKEFANELRMTIESMTASEYPDEEILDTVESKINEEVSS
jgi:DNA-binding transcriptional regulator YhcF (GntR family)